MIFLSFVCALLLPRQFHVAVVENNSEREVGVGAWLFPLYLVAINIFVVPIAAAGMVIFANGGANPDMYVVLLPLDAGSWLFTIIAFIGGLSAATAMVIVASVALAVMVCNDLVAPVLLRRADLDSPEGELGTKLLMIRRFAILVLLMLAYAYYRAIAGNAALAAMGLVSFAAIAQLAPAFFIGLIWRRATAVGAMAGMITGIVVWAFTLLVPNLADAGLIPASAIENGLLGISFLRPERLFGIEFEPLTHGVFWSLTFNVIAYVTVSVLRHPQPIERLQATQFVPEDLRPTPHGIRLPGTRMRVGDIEETIAKYLGEERARRHIASFSLERGQPLSAAMEADVHLVRYAERILASAIGAASARVALSLLLERRNAGSVSARQLLDDASAALQYNRDLLQSALDHVHQGIGVFDRNLRLICWNRQFRSSLELPAEFGQVGTTLSDIFRHALSQNEQGHTGESALDDRLARDGARGEFPDPAAIDRAGHGTAARFHAGRRPRHHRVGRIGTGTRGTGPCRGERNPGTTGARAYRGADPAQRRPRTRPRQRRERQCRQDPLPRRRRPRHPATAQRGPALRVEPGRAAAAAGGKPHRPEHRRVPGGGRGDPLHAAGHFPPRRRRDEAGVLGLLHQRHPQADAGRIRRDGGRETPGTAHGPMQPQRAQRQAFRAPAAAEPDLQRDQVHPRGPRACRLPPQGRTAGDLGARHRRGHSRKAARRHIRRVPAAGGGREDGARARPGAVHRRPHGAGAEDIGGGALDRRARLGVLDRVAAGERAGGRDARHRDRAWDARG